MPDGHEILLSNLGYINFYNRRCIFYEEGKQPYACTLSMKHALELLEMNEAFMQINPSVIINLNQVESEHNQTAFVRMKNGHYIKVDKSKRDEFLQKYDR